MLKIECKKETSNKKKTLNLQNNKKNKTKGNCIKKIFLNNLRIYMMIIINYPSLKCSKGNPKPNVLKLNFSDASIIEKWEKFWQMSQRLAHLSNFFSFPNDTCIRKIGFLKSSASDYPYCAFNLD